MKFVFVGGSPRSGTTLLGSMLGNHPNGFAIPEASFKREIGRILRTTTDETPARRASLLTEALNSNVRFKVWRMPLAPGELEPILNEEPTLGGVLGYLAVSYAVRAGVKKDIRFVVDHDPGSIQRVEEMERAIPGVKHLHIIRDGRAVMASFRSLDWGPTNPMRAAVNWTSNLSFGLSLEITGSCTRILYEHVLRDPVTAMKRATEAVGLDFHDAVTTSEGTVLPSYTQQQHRLVGQAVDPSRIDKWKGTLSARDIELFEHRAGPLLSTLGYERMFPTTRRPSGFEKASLKLRDLVETRRKRRRGQARVRKNT